MANIALTVSGMELPPRIVERVLCATRGLSFTDLSNVEWAYEMCIVYSIRLLEARG